MVLYRKYSQFQTGNWVHYLKVYIHPCRFEEISKKLENPRKMTRPVTRCFCGVEHNEWYVVNETVGLQEARIYIFYNVFIIMLIISVTLDQKFSSNLEFYFFGYILKIQNIFVLLHSSSIRGVLFKNIQDFNLTGNLLQFSVDFLFKIQFMLDLV